MTLADTVSISRPFLVLFCFYTLLNLFLHGLLLYQIQGQVLVLAVKLGKYKCRNDLGSWYKMEKL